MDRVKGKVVIVTGGANGIGEACVLLLAQEGAQVAVIDIDDEPGRNVVQRVKDAGGEAEYWHCDLRVEREVQEMMAAVHDRFGRINAIVNNAGVTGVNKPAHEVTEEEWDYVFSIDVKGVFFCTKHVIPYLREVGGGSIVNMASSYGLIGSTDIPPYHAAKGAVTTMTKTDAVCYAKDGIRVNSVHPSTTMTPLVRAHGEKCPGGLEGYLEDIKRLHPVGRAAEPVEIAYGVVYLVSDESKFMTGSQLVIDGGYTAQ